MTKEDELARVRRLGERAEEEGPLAEVLPHQPPTGDTGLPPEMVITFGQHLNPQPFGYVVTVGQMNDQRAVFLTFEHAHGRITFPLTDTEAQGLANRLQQNARGLVIAQDLPPKT